MAKNDLHVVLQNGRWGVKREEASRVFRTFDAKADAIDAAHQIAVSEGTDVIVHGKTGQPFLDASRGIKSSLNEKAIRGIMRSGLLDDSRSASKASASKSRKASKSTRGGIMRPGSLDDSRRASGSKSRPLSKSTRGGIMRAGSLDQSRSASESESRRTSKSPRRGE
jgi:hypothetical protein